MPRYFKPWAEGLSELRKNLRPVGDDPELLQGGEGLARRAGWPPRDIDPAQANAMVMWGQEGTRPLLTVFDPQSLQVRAMLRVHRQR